MAMTSDRQVAKNTIILFLRMLAMLIASFYASRLALNGMGLVDFGIFNLVNSFLALFAFVNGSLSGATSRFLMYNIGKQDDKALRSSFNSSLLIHFCVAILVLIVAEMIGPWVIEHKLVIPLDRISAAKTIYQVIAIGTAISILQIPFYAAIVAHEKMHAFAYLSVLQAIMKVLAGGAILVFGYDHMILYSLIVTAASIGIFVLHVWYCRRHFTECKSLSWADGSIAKPILAFVASDIYGNIALTLSNQGSTILLNTFFGATINAATGVAGQVQGAIFGFATSFLTAIQPQLVKRYAAGNLAEMFSLMNFTSRLAFTMSLALIMPIFADLPFLLQLWLNITPDHTVEFCRIGLVMTLLHATLYPIGYSIHATGKIRKLSFVSGSLYMLVLPFSYLLMLYNPRPEIPALVNLAILVVAYSYNLVLLKEVIPEFPFGRFIKEVIIPCCKTLTAPLFALILSELFLRPNLTKCLIDVLVSLTLTSLAGWIWMFDDSTKRAIKNRVTFFWRSIRYGK